MKADYDGHNITLTVEEGKAYPNDIELRRKVFKKAMSIFDETGSELTVCVFVDGNSEQIDAITTETDQP